MAVDVAHSTNLQLHDRERLRRDDALAAGVRPETRNSECQVDAGGNQRALAGSVTGVPPSVIDAQDSHGASLLLGERKLANLRARRCGSSLHRARTTRTWEVSKS
jgi:hypothetical protein